MHYIYITTDFQFFTKRVKRMKFIIIYPNQVISFTTTYKG